MPTSTETMPGFDLTYRPPLAWPELLRFLQLRSAPCVAQVAGNGYRCTVACGGATGWLNVTPAPGAARLTVRFSPALCDHAAELRSGLRRLFDLDADPVRIARHLSADATLAPVVNALPGLRVPGALGGFALALRCVIGQQVSVKGASTLFTRVVQRYGATIDTPFEGLDRLAPTAVALAEARMDELAGCGFPRRRAETIRALARAVADDALMLDGSVAAADTRAALLALPGIGPWSADYIAMRALHERDAFPASDLGVMRALKVARAADVERAAERWRPWRAYATMYLWQMESGKPSPAQ